MVMLNCEPVAPLEGETETEQTVLVQVSAANEAGTKPNEESKAKLRTNTPTTATAYDNFLTGRLNPLGEGRFHFGNYICLARMMARARMSNSDIQEASTHEMVVSTLDYRL